MSSNEKTRHLLIAGTGRAGTSFLVKYLTEMGLDTHLSRNKQNSAWDESANAGLENFPLKTFINDLPYVIKTPWLYEFVEQVLLDSSILIDAVVIPVRDLVDATISRAIIHRAAINRTAEHLLHMDKSWETIGYVSGGMIFSLNPIDQARILAVGFHHLIHKLVQADIPIILMDFPRFVENSDYLFGKLKHLLPSHISEKEAHQIHQSIADASKIRVNKEQNHVNQNTASTSSIEDTIIINKLHEVPSSDKIDNISLRRELIRIRKELAKYSEIILQKDTDILAILESSSWRLTKPLRIIKQYLSKWLCLSTGNQ